MTYSELFTNVFHGVIGFKRSWNARSVGDEGWLSIVEAAVVAGLMIGRNRSDQRFVTTTISEGEALRDVNTDMDDEAAAGIPSADDIMADLDAFSASIALPTNGQGQLSSGQSGSGKKLTIARTVDMIKPPDLGNRTADDMLRILRELRITIFI